MRVATKRARGAGVTRWLLLSLIPASVPLACGGGSGGPTDPGPEPDTSVASVSVSAPSTSVEAGGSVQLAAVAKNASGQTLSGKSFTWSTSDDARAEVSASGLATTHAEGGVTITATETGSGKAGSIDLTITAAAVHTVTVTPASVFLDSGESRKLTAELKDARGNVLTGRTIAWSSGDAGVVTVDGTGLVTAVGSGAPVAITATSEGKSGTAQVFTEASTADRVVITPRFVAVDVDATATVGAKAFDASGFEIPEPTVAWASAATQKVAVDSAGVVRGVSAGMGSIIAQVDAASDTAWVAVLGERDLLSTAFVGGSAVAEVNPGQTMEVAVLLDLSKLGTDGDLGSVQFDLRYDDEVLVYQSAEAGVSGTASHNLAAPGLFKFSFASTAAQGRPDLTLVTITFQVASSAPIGARSALDLEYTAAPTGTAFQEYATPIAAAGRIQVVAP